MKNKVSVFNESLIEEFAKQLNPQYVDSVFNDINQILANSINKLCERRPIITSYNTIIVNECSTFTECQTSSMDMFVVISSPQLKLSTVNLNKNYLKKWLNKLKIAYNQTKKQPKKRSRFRKNKKQKTEQQKPMIDISEKKYTIVKFKQDLMYMMANFLTDKTVLFVNKYGISLKSSDELGMNINMFFVFENGEGKYKLFDASNFKFIDIELGYRYKFVHEKSIITNDDYRKVLRIFNGLYLNVMSKPLNQILIESILYNCPTELFTGTTNEMFLKILNYINFKSLSEMVCITDYNKCLLECNLIRKNDVNEFKRFLKILLKNL